MCLCINRDILSLCEKVIHDSYIQSQDKANHVLIFLKGQTASVSCGLISVTLLPGRELKKCI